ncbi:MAG TPA: glycosyltransferase family 39 protein [Stellaceae bacterium]|nr:glycosyltransferase family 39 protein [Stellaceae bacterium]
MIERWSEGWRPYALLLLLTLALYLPGIAALPVTDRDEARFAQASRQMLESGDYLRIRFQDEARNKKPVGVYWLQAASVALVSDAASTAIWPYRLPSLVGAIAAVLLTFALGRALVGATPALLGAALLAASFGVVTEAHLAKTDAVLLATVVAAQGSLGRIYIERRRGGVSASPATAALFWVAQALGILVKGPVTPLVSLFTAAALSLADREARWLSGVRAQWGVPLMLLIAAPWFIAIAVATDGAFFTESVSHDFFGKLLGAQEAHGAPPGSYLLLSFATFWPGSLLLAPTLLWTWRERRMPAERFLIAWIVPFWIALELIPTKLPNYVLPLYPALALLAGRALLAIGGAIVGRWRAVHALMLAIWLIVAVALAAALAILPLSFGRLAGGAGIVAAAVLLVFGTRLAWAAWRHPGAGLAARLALLALLVFAPAFGLVVPSLDPLWLSRGAAGLVARLQPPAAAPVAVVGYAEPSLVFMLGTRTRNLPPEAAASYLTTTPGAAALVSDRDDAAFRRALATRGWEARLVDHVAGIDTAHGKRMVLSLYQGAPG